MYVESMGGYTVCSVSIAFSQGRKAIAVQGVTRTPSPGMHEGNFKYIAVCICISICTISSQPHAAASAVVLCMSVEDIKTKIEKFEDEFKQLKKSTQECLIRCGSSASVEIVVEYLTDLSADDMPDHKVFLKTELNELFNASNHYKLFSIMNFYWNYLSYHLLHHLIVKFADYKVKCRMDMYRVDLKQFMKIAPLKVFCKAHKKRRQKPPQDFVEMVSEFKWPDNVTLEVVENFREEYASEYRLHDCAMMLNRLWTHSFIITWFVPISIVDRLTTTVPEELFVKFNVVQLEIAGKCVYKRPKVSKRLSYVFMLESFTNIMYTILFSIGV